MIWRHWRYKIYSKIWVGNNWFNNYTKIMCTYDYQANYLYTSLSTIAIHHRPALTKIHTQLATILKVYNSSRKVNTLELGNLCKDTYLLILDSFPWASITPTLHKILAHSEELIRESNAGFGLKDFSEEGTESCNKLIRKYRENLARKNSFETNLMDIFVRLASQSDPISVSYRRSLTCERCGQSGHSIRSKCCESHNIQDPSNIDALFASLTCSS